MGLVLWLAEGLLHFFVFDGQGVLEVLLPSTLHELWMRSLVTGIFIGFGIHAQFIINKLRESRERYRSLFENAPDAIFLADAESGEILDANPAASQLLLRPHKEIVGRHQSQLHPPALEDDSKKTFTDHIGQIRKGRRTQPVEHVALRSDGVEVPVEIVAQFVHMEGRSTVQGIFHDLTERKKAQEELEHANRRLTTVMDSLDALVYVADMDTHELLFVNKFGRDTWGDVTGQTCWKALQAGRSGPCEFCTNHALVDDHGQPSGVHRWEFQNTVDGQWYDCHDQAIQWTDGHLVRMEIASNITERKQIEEAVKRQAELLDSIQSTQSLFISGDDPQPVFDSLLATLVDITDSEYGFLDEVLQDENGQLIKRSLALSNISWDDKSRRLYEALRTSNLEFRNLSNLAGAPAATGKLVIANTPAHHPHSGGVPQGHPPIQSYMGIPMFFGGELVGVAGVANRDGGYSGEIAAFLDTFVSTCAGIIQAIREDQKKQQIDKALRVSEEKYRRVVEDQTEFVVRWRPDGVRTFVNDSYCRYFGISCDEAIGTSFFPLITEDHQEVVRKRIESATPENPVSTGEHRIIHPDGTIGWNQWTDGAIFDACGQLIEFQSVGRDVSERKQAEEALAASKAFAENVIETANAIVVVLESDGKITTFNRFAEGLTGYRKNEVLGQKWVDLFVAQDEKNAISEVHERVLEDSPEASTHENFIITKHGEKRLISWNNHSIRNNQGEVIGAIAIGLDITEQKQAQEGLAIFKRLAEACAQGMGMADLEGRIVYCNDALCQTFFGEKEAKNAYGKHVSCYYDEASAQKLQEQILPLVQDTGRWTGEIPLVSAEGEVTEAIQSIFLIRNDKGEPSYLANIVTDIGEQKRARKALKQSEQKYRSLFDNMLDGFAYHRIIVDEDDQPLDYEFLEINDAFERLTGLKRQEVIGKKVTDVIPGIRDSDFDWIKAYGEVALQGTHRRFEQPSPELDRWYSISAYSPHQGYFAATFEDVTDKKRAEMALKESEEQVRLLLDSTAEAIYGLDLEGNCTFCNPACLKILGYEHDRQLLGQNMHRLIHHTRPDGSAYPIAECQICKTFQYGQGVHVDDEVLWRSNGSSFPTEYRSYPVRRAGDIVGSVVTFLDITERIEAERRAEQHQTELAHVSRLSTLGEMASGLAHEINQPLASILSHADLCLSTIKADQSQIGALAEHLEEIGNQAELAGEVVRRIRGFSRKQSPEPSHCHINEIVNEAVGLIQWEARREGIDIRTELTQSPAVVCADRVQLEQVILNLARNGLEAMQETDADTRELVIETQITADMYVELTVQDSGRGIPEHIEATMFDPFSTSKSQGLGLGLAIGESIIREHQGRLRLVSSDSSGTTMAFELPMLIQAGAPAEAAKPQAITALQARRKGTQQKRIKRKLDFKE
jgi:two-component system, cell cycle sensor histidine kinase and response regulator CckA